VLILTRKKDEAILIGKNVRVVVIDVKGDQVRLGIVAPKKVEVYREEIYHAIKQENTCAVFPTTGDLTHVPSLDPKLKEKKN